MKIPGCRAVKVVGILERYVKFQGKMCQCAKKKVMGQLYKKNRNGKVRLFLLKIPNDLEEVSKNSAPQKFPVLILIL